MSTNQPFEVSSVVHYGPRLPRMIIRPKIMVFAIVFVLVFLLSGILTVVTSSVYRMGLVSVLVIPLFVLYGPVIDRILFAYIALVCVVVLSAFYNQSSLFEVVLFMRILGFSYLMYYLVEIAIKPQTMTKVLKACIAISSIQLPVILLQWSIFDRLPSRWRAGGNPFDFGFGTFNFMSDYAMTFMIVLVIVFLLFNGEQAKIVRRRWPLLIWLSLTVLIANAQIVKIILALVWLLYLAKHFRLKTILASAAAFLVLAIAAYMFNSSGLLTEDIGTVVERLTIGRTTSTTDQYLSGEYSRFAAIVYVFQNPSLLGDGPSAYANPLTRELLRGNHGHFFTFVAEVGWAGLIASMFIFFLIASPIHLGWRRLTICWPTAAMFGAVTILSFTSAVMNDISIMLILCLMAKYYRIHSVVPGTRTVLTW